MTASHSVPLHQDSLSLRHAEFVNLLANTENLLLIQDLDGVCMELVRDPLQRTIDCDYVKATTAFDNHFFVLTNGEHVGKRGVNGIVEKAFGYASEVKQQGWYLPGLAAGGIQWQDRFGHLSHPGVSDAEWQFLQTIPQTMATRLRQFLQKHQEILSAAEIEQCVDACVLDHVASPTANLNTAFDRLHAHPEIYAALQQDMQQLMVELLQEASRWGLGDSFFVHYAPNLGKDAQGNEILQPATDSDSGTTDFQFMLRGAMKEAGVLVILNYYYFLHTGHYPLGKDFNARTAPKSHAELLQAVTEHFDPKLMPVMVGVGDTVTSQLTWENDRWVVRRGGSDRNFLQLVQDIGKQGQTGNVVVYVDSSGGEVKNRKPLRLEPDTQQTWYVVEGPGDRRDTNDPLQLNIVFPGGHQQYALSFRQAAQKRRLSL
ncbi:glucosylglycerol 3-phosphatase [Geitlerinema sp. PCC 9228]|uniref:glucosylglycerol 3-phosphatase n=1 Tax=Geitlerinema sp. PCC 9228 TaxID=111611 RepID=UPI0008F9AB98|nr:glucosylglycerol 3-phosphatase [Geitlerinema sp. PCC 9228]